MLWVKSFHIVFVSSWFAGLFYLPRIFVNLAMVDVAPSAERDRLLLMARKLLRFTHILSVVAVALGLWLWAGYGIGWGEGKGWMHAKLGFVVALLAYHLFCYRLMGQLQAGICRWGPKQLRALNELPTLLLVVVVMLVVFKAQFPTGAATWLQVGLVLFMAASIQFYARWRRLRAEREANHAS